ncbi:glutathione S-transferase [Synechocystis sp. CACIAM 05]|uniref:glutathione S-transferase n=1 Tax=Synechocystis sp. CACIAM 05 TaxID=1933929 RepID=UPI00138E8EDF|nr:glutathione S-transferase family protein [Synechocystis sp. CACIAM 05]QHV01482.1 glutathione S-transferase [Synechocystis sp. CACIAM 05]
MLELHQFELSQYSEKVRLILDFKGLDYRTVEVVPGVGQIDLLRLSGQTKVPVLKDGDIVIADSTEIALYLDRKYPENPLLPHDPVQRGQCLLMEEWADESIGLKGRVAMVGALNQNPGLRASILPKQTPGIFKNLVSAVPPAMLDLLGSGVGFGGDAVKEAMRGLHQDLEALTLILQHQPYLIGDRPTLADLTVAALSMVIKIPGGNYLNIAQELKGKGIPGLADNSAYSAFFEWRDRLYREYRRSHQQDNNQNNGSGSSNNSSPTTITIE